MAAADATASWPAWVDPETPDAWKALLDQIRATNDALAAYGSEPPPKPADEERESRH